MKRSVKETLKSVIVLFTITLVCVGLLSVANEYLKYEAKLDADMAKHLYAVCPTGESSDANAIDYFELVDATDSVKKVNETYGSASTKVIAVYRSTKGANAGRYIVQAQSQGHVAEVVMLTSYDESGKIMKTTCYSQSESYGNKISQSWFDSVVGKEGELESTDFATNTGATNTLSAISRAVTISNFMAQTLINTIDPALETSLNEALPAASYEKVLDLSGTIDAINAASPDADTKILEIYRATEGENAGKYIILAQSKNGQWYPPLQMLTSYDDSGKIIKTVCHYCEDSYYNLVQESWYGNVAGKDGTITDADFAMAGTGATNTLATMARAITLSNRMIRVITVGPSVELAASLHSVCPAGAEIDVEGYERVTDMDALIASVNATAPDETTKVLEVYKVVKGENTGKYIILAQSKNGQWYPPLQMVTSYDDSGKIIKTACHYQAEGYWDKVEPANFDNVSGKNGTITDADFATGTGATNTYATIAKAITLSNSLAATITGGNA